MSRQQQIEQGEIYWVDLGEPIGSSPGYTHPCVVIQNNIFNVSRINTTLIMLLTSNLRRSQAPGNVLLNPGEAALPQQSVVVVSQIYTVDKSQLVEQIGKLSARRVLQILQGLYLLTEPREVT